MLEFAEINKNHFFVVVASRVKNECENEVEVLKSLGMMLENRFISDDELFSVYGIASFVWFFYSGYDTVSGIYGRVLQLEVTPKVHTDSIISKLSDNLNIPYVKFKTEDFYNLKKLKTKMTDFDLQRLSLSKRRNIFYKS